jgi:lipopolysaccharide export system protein LptA
MQLAAGGAAGSPGARVDDARATVEGRKIDLRLDGGSLVADGDVRSLLKSSSDRQAGRAPGAPAASTVHRPGMLKDNQPVNVTARHLDYDSAAGRALYTGDARLWQGETAVQAESLTLDDAKGDLVGQGKVRSTLRLQQKDAKTGKTEPQTTVVTSNALHYEDDERRATYTENARMNGPEGDLHADRIELFLDETGDGLERLEAYSPVTLKTDRRSSYGTHLTYYAADERYVMSGVPVRVLEQLPQECRETIGKTLTFYRSADTISVDGNEESRTQSTSGGRCPEPRSN